MMLHPACCICPSWSPFGHHSHTKLHLFFWVPILWAKISQCSTTTLTQQAYCFHQRGKSYKPVFPSSLTVLFEETITRQTTNGLVKVTVRTVLCGFSFFSLVNSELKNQPHKDSKTDAGSFSTEVCSSLLFQLLLLCSAIDVVTCPPFPSVPSFILMILVFRGGHFNIDELPVPLLLLCDSVLSPALGPCCY